MFQTDLDVQTKNVLIVDERVAASLLSPLRMVDKLDGTAKLYIDDQIVAQVR